MTNREALNAMSDEEFAMWLSRAGTIKTETVYLSDDDWDIDEDLTEYRLSDIYGEGGMKFYYYDSCDMDILEWLQDEYGDEYGEDIPGD